MASSSQLLESLFESGGSTSPDVNEVNMEEVLNALSQGVTSSEPKKSRPFRRQRRGNRLKVYDNGFIFIYDKDSSCKTRSFWRCERKSECPARVHTNPVTNEVVKRIHRHTHEPPSPDELPPWISVKNECYDDRFNRSMSPEEIATSTTGLSFARTFHPGFPPNTYDQPESSKSDEAKEIDVEELSEDPKGQATASLLPTNSPVDFTSQLLKMSPVPADRKTPSSTSSEPIDKSDEFWDLFNATKRMVELLARGGKIEWSNDKEAVKCDTEVAQFLQENGLSQYKSTFANYSLANLKRMSLDDCTRLCSQPADALLLHLSLHPTPVAGSEALVVYVSSTPAKGHEPMYQMLRLVDRTTDELARMLVQKCSLKKDDVERLAVAGPAKIQVAISDDVIAQWPQNAVFQYTLNNGTCKFTQIN